MDALHAHGIDEWSAVCSRSFVPLRADGDTGFRGLVRHRQLGRIGVSYVEATASRVYRPAPLIASEPRDDILLSLHLTGTGQVTQAGRTAGLASGAGALYEADRPYALGFPGAMSELVLQVPRRQLRVRDCVLREATARRIDASGHLTVLRHFLGGVLAASDFDASEADTVADTAVGLLNATLTPLVGATPTALSGEALWHAVCADLLRWHADPELSITALAGRHGVSRRHLEVVFARHGDSPAARLRRVRLARAEELLTRTSSTVTQIAYACGFADVNTFIRAFRRAHDCTPESWRRQPAD